jgi:PAS domain S-box-containing protein
MNLSPQAAVSTPRVTQRQSSAGVSGPSISALQTLVEQSDEGMILADERGIISWANPAAAALIGSIPAELIGKNGFDLCRPEQLAQARDGFARCLADPRQAVSLRIDAQRGEGAFRPLDVKLLNRLDDAGIRAVIVRMHAAVLPTQGAGLDPQSRDEPYKTLFEDALLGLGVADMEGNLLVFNNAMLQPGEYTREDILQIGNVARLYSNSADRDRILGIARAKGHVWREAVQFRRKDGSSYDTLITLVPVRFRGRLCWYATVEDVTEQKRAEEKRVQLEAQLRQAQKMEALGRMTSGIAHDFRNVLTIILLSAEQMATGLAPEALDLRRDLEDLQKAARRGVSMIQKLLGFSRNAPLKVAPTNLSELAKRLLGTLRHLLPGNISVRVEGADQSTAAVDPAAMEEILTNLVTNARDAMEGGGVLRIEVRPAMPTRAELEARPWMTPGEYTRLSVIDTGQGMDEATRARVLEPFFTTKAVGIGTGLGLAMVYGLVKQQRGFIDVESVVGVGTSVHLYFPRSP